MSDFARIMETHKVKEEVVEAVDEQDTDLMTISQFYLYRQNTSASPPMIKQRKPLETKEKLVRTMKSRTGLPHETKQVISYDMGKTVSYSRKRALVDQFCDHLEAKSPVMKRAEEIQANLAPEFPSFTKTMLFSHVTRGFGMRLPKEFCYLHMPRHDTTVHLISESGEAYIVKYLVEKDARCGLSSGWRVFSFANKLLEGDVLVFQFVKPSKFKVYIVRANGLSEVDAALGLLSLDSRAHQMNFKERIVRPLPMKIIQENTQQKNPMILKSNLTDQSEIDSEDNGSEVSNFATDFKEVGSIDNFTIFVNGSIINSDLSEYHRTKYYELCCDQNSFLHNHLLETVSCKLAAEIMSQTVNIADAIRACKLSTSPADYLTWDKTLEAFELLGINVGFLRAKISRLWSLAFESQEAVDSKRLREATLKKFLVEEETRTLELQLLDIKKVLKKLDIETETLKVNAERHELMFQDEANGLRL